MVSTLLAVGLAVPALDLLYGVSKPFGILADAVVSRHDCNQWWRVAE